jgi:hypothetical protein
MLPVDVAVMVNEMQRLYSLLIDMDYGQVSYAHSNGAKLISRMADCMLTAVREGKRVFTHCMVRSYGP